MEIKYTLRMLQKGWWLILLTLFVSLLAVLIPDYLATPQYRATARFVLSPSNSEQMTGSELVDSLAALEKRNIIQTYAEFLSSDRIYEEAIRELQLTTTDVAAYTRSTTVVPDSNLLELSFVGPDPNLAANLANSVGRQAIGYITQMYRVYDVSVLDPAAAPITPISPQPLRDVALAAAVGLVLGAVLAILQEQIGYTLDSFRQRLVVDKASGAYSQRFLRQRLEAELKHSPDGDLSFGLVRLDGLQELVETAPLYMVNNLLRQVVVALRNELRGNDLVGRWNTLTFAILLPTTPARAANRTIERITAPLTQPVMVKQFGEQIYLQPKVCVITPQPGETVMEVIEKAERALVYEKPLAAADAPTAAG